MSHIWPYEVVLAMETYGGSFVRALAEAINRADENNQQRLRNAFPELFEEYQELARLRKAQATPKARERCKTCDGFGDIKSRKLTIPWVDQIDVCPRCQGEGWEPRQ